ncbi:proteasome accessory factor PafA2 family protein [Pseudenhygromyxa sp. WMMC2535]|uniref:proteasome accessory factor PafA2 family protein n=1 Tax=Pseudenhygromyxa sp. WMMC2535 TaxID=2712867 RepID=UPI0015539F5C|nr:proteasome accessory factor PafA2 family protein [Pseudenhygromyxa sp. WMMC2535]NVB38704.1 proteasome accessory factor PafA2 family protein [Pseudenhygromyxa sp. WMMC2535]
MLERLLGLETEYAIRYSDPGGPRPSHRLIFEAISASVAARVATVPGQRGSSHGQRFVENGGALYYEFVPSAPEGGVVEASTPECRGPSQLLLYQKAQERLLLDALPDAQRKLAAVGFTGSLGLVKNCRDAEGHIYGAQENYEVELASGPRLWVYRLGTSLLIPLILALSLLTLVLAVALGLTFGLTLIVMAAGGRRLRERLAAGQGELPVANAFLRLFNGLAIVVTSPGAWLYSLLFRATCCRRIRRDALAFLLSRPLLSGAGSYEPRTGDFALSEKGLGIRKLVRTGVMPADRSVFDIGHLIKALYAPTYLQLRPLFGLFARRQRLQLGLSDSNLAQSAEYLKVATTALVFDMAEAGALRRLPRLRRPLIALRVLNADPTLRAEVPCTDGVSRSGLALQRLYLDAAREFVASSPTCPLEAHELLRRWAEVLDALEDEPARLFGRVDWVSKRALIEQAGAGLDPAAKKKIDLKYHELGDGYFAALEDAGLAPTLVSPDEVTAAVHTPPQDSPARRRSQLLRSFAAAGVAARVSWDRVEVPAGRLRKQVIRLDDYRRR